MGNLKLVDLVDIEKLNQVQVAFTRATGVASIITNLDGTPITKPVSFCQLCNNIIRKTEKGLRLCEKSDAEFGLSSDRVTIKECGSAGLLDGGIRLDVLGEPVGIWMIGQVIDENTDIEKLIDYADVINTDKNEYREALEKVPHMTRNKFEDICDFLNITANLLMELIESNIRLKDENRKISETEKVASEGEVHYRKLFDSMINSYAIHEMIYDKDGNAVDYKIIDANSAFLKDLGLAKEDFIGKPIKTILPKTEKHWIEHFDKVIQTGEDQIFTDYSIELNKSYLVHAFKFEENRFGAIFSDITDYSKEREHLHRTQRLETVGNLAGGIAHEINNPINGIMNYAQLILDMKLDNSSVTEYLEEIISESERIAEIINNLLRFSQNDSKGYSLCTPTDIIKSTIEMVKSIYAGEQIKIETYFAKDLPKIKCNSGQMQQVIINLLANARDALNDKYLGYDDNKIIKVSCKKIKKEKKEIIRITIEDRGNGIKPEVSNRMFEPFFSSKGRDSKTGLGLSTSYGIVIDHGGTLNFETKIGEYTRFFVDIPYN